MEHTVARPAAADVSMHVQELTARNLQLLQAIEGTLAVLSADKKLFDAATECLQELSERLQRHVPALAIDPQGLACNALSMAAESAQRIYTKAISQHKAACDDPQLTADDGVADAYAERLSALERLFDATVGLREWIETHDDVLEPSTGVVYKNVDELFAALSK